jgi:hypothetical protein
MYLKKEISISFFIITISASNLYMPMYGHMLFCWIFLFRSYVAQICSAPSIYSYNYTLQNDASVPGLGAFSTSGLLGKVVATPHLPSTQGHLTSMVTSLWGQY